MKVLVTNAYFYKLDPKQWRFKEPYPPYGTLIISALLKQHNYQVKFHDTCLTNSPTEIEPLLQSFKPDVLVIYEDGFNYLTKMCLTVMRKAAFDLAKLGKKHNCFVLMNSSDATDHSTEYLNNNVDFVLPGEGEETLVELLEAIKQKQNLSNISGLRYIKNNCLIETPKRPVLKELDKLPQADWDEINFENYKNVWLQKHPNWALNIATTRGCPFKCNWCAKPIYGNRYNTRSPEKVVNEIKYLVNKTNCTHFWMCDDIFGLKPGWVQQFNRLVQQQNLKFKYKIQSRADLLLKEDNIDVLIASGLDEVWIGAESGSQRILDLMDKGTTIQQIEKNTQILQTKGVKVAYFLQFGYMDESWEEIMQTIEMVKRNMPNKIGISISYPLPGTKFYNMVQQQMKSKQNWDDSDDLSMMYQGTFSSKFYKILYAYVHATFNKEQALDFIKSKIGKPKKPTINKGTFKKFVLLPYYSLKSKWLYKKLQNLQ